MTTQNFKVRNGLEVGNVVIDAASANIIGVGNLTVTQQSNLGNISNVKISGGQFGYYTVTDGAGNLSFVQQSPAANAVESLTLTGSVNSSNGTSVSANIYLANSFLASTASLVIYNATTQFSGSYILKVKYLSGNFWAVGYTSSAAIVNRSSDGVNWTNIFSDGGGGGTSPPQAYVNIATWGTTWLIYGFQGQASPAGVYIYQRRSTNNGSTWTAAATAVFPGLINSAITFIGGDAGDGSTALGFASFSGTPAVFEQDNTGTGLSWGSALTGAPAAPALPTAQDFFAYNNGYWYTLAANARIYYSTNINGSFPWQTYNTLPSTPRGIGFSNGNLIISCNDGNIYTGTLGSANTAFNILYTANCSGNSVSSIVSPGNSVIWALPSGAASSGNTLLSNDGGRTWQFAGNDSALPTFTAGVYSNTAGYGVAATSSGKIGNLSGTGYLTTYSFSVPSYGTYAGNANIFVAFANNDTAATGITKIYNAFANANTGGANWTISNSASGIANSISVYLNTQNNTSVSVSVTAAYTTANTAITTSSAYAANINLLTNANITSFTPVIYDSVTLTDPVNGNTFTANFYPGNTTTQVATTLATANLQSWTISSSFNQLTLARKSTGQLTTAQFPTITVTPAANGNSTLGQTQTITSFGQGAAVAAANIILGVFSNSTSSGSLQNNFNILPYFLGTVSGTSITTSVGTVANIGGLGLTYYYNGGSGYLLNTTGANMVVQIGASFHSTTNGAAFTFWPLVDFNNTAPGYSSFPSTLQATTNIYPSMYTYSNGTDTYLGMNSSVVNIAPNGTLTLYAYLPTSAVIGSSNPSWPISATRLSITRFL